MCNSSDLLSAAIQTLPPLQQDIVLRTMDLPGKRTRLFRSEALKIWNLSPGEFDRHREAALRSLRLYLSRHGVAGIADLDLSIST